MGLVEPGGGGGGSTLLDCAVRPIIRNRILLKYLVYGFECLERTSYKNTLQIYNCTKQKVHYYPKRKVEFKVEGPIMGNKIMLSSSVNIIIIITTGI